MISDGIYFRNVMIQALNDLVLESLVSFAFVRFPRLYLALFGVFSSQCIFVFWEISLQALFAGYRKEVCIHGATARPNCCAFGITCFRKAWY